jgi:hypothetical protein
MTIIKSYNLIPRQEKGRGHKSGVTAWVETFQYPWGTSIVVLFNKCIEISIFDAIET